MSKAFEELDVIDDFLINAIASDPEVGEPFCRTVLSVLLQKHIDKLRIITQKCLPAIIPGLRGIRMDVEIQEDIVSDNNGPEMNIYDLEPHLQRNMHFPRHNRFYQAKIDSTLIAGGNNDFSKMPNLYVITITNFDIFGKDYMMYNIHNMCEEIPELQYDDGLKFIYFYTNGTKGGSQDIRAMLRYLQDSSENNITNEATRTIHNYVNHVKVLPEVKRNYMKFEELMLYAQQEGYAAGHAEGHAAGHAKGLSEGLQQGQSLGTIQSIFELLKEKGKLSSDAHTVIAEETSISQLLEWLLLASKSESVEEFESNM